MIQISGLKISYGQEEIFDNFSFSLNKGEKLALTGESGKGKSSLLNLIAGFIPEFSGNILIDGIELNENNITEIRNKIAWLPQDTSLNSKTVKELLYAPFEFLSNKGNIPKEPEVIRMFSNLLLSKDIFGKKLKEISGGQKQRVIMSGCLLLKKPILLLDEPTSALDEGNKKAVTDLVLSNKELTVIAATHDEYWMKCSDKIIEL